MFMKRRKFIKLIAAITCMSATPSVAFAETVRDSSENRLDKDNNAIKDYLLKMENFDKNHNDDFYLGEDKKKILKSTVLRLDRIQKIVGHGNFCLLDFDDALKIAETYPSVGAFSREELDFIEMVFYKDASVYGFNDMKPLVNLTSKIEVNKVVKIPYTGNYLYQGLPTETYYKLKKDIGEAAILTSGLRSVTKQLYLFLNKAYRNDCNMSIASRSLAPPGYSFHGVGDFDIGQVNFGHANFTKQFTTSNVYQKLRSLDYVKIRYEQNNLLGVRYEPWHIKLYS